ncbi:MAG: transpeptidase family protein [Tannerellaceae bacterium]|jgi:cell division protein FtsI (penicillin-binding protein 3)|nr:transpeptidase family protein [Tannerellaceae bacterium]
MSVDANKNDTRILICYFVVVLLLGAVAVAITVRAFNTSLVEREKWEGVARTLQRPDRTVYPVRGNIYSCDGKQMAVSVPAYYLYIDFRADGFQRDSFLYSKRNGLDSLSLCLSHLLKDRSPADYRSFLLRGLRSGNRQFLLYRQRVSYTTLKKIRSFPFFRFGRMRSGLYTREMAEREKPFGMLASRTIGDIYGEREQDGLTRGKNGLELQYDSLLRGEPGLSSVRRVGGAWTNVTEIEPENGMDIRTTIDTRIQDITEQALLEKLRSLNAESGTAVVMEVATGEIRAITNMERMESGSYAESRNHAVADETEPGSTFKVASMMVALEDEVCSPRDKVDTGNGIFMYAGVRMTDHNADRGGNGLITAEEVIRYSSNIGMAKIILKGYEQQPEKFVKGLYRLGLNIDLHVEIPGAGKSKIRMPDKTNWSKTALPWMSFGYETQIPPLQMLTFFNAIANDGKMVRPRFTKEISHNGKVIRRSSVEVVKSSICSDKTLDIIREMLVNVVEKGTGKPAKSSFISIAGKTGTAQIASGGVYRTAGHLVSFCGYFPADNPKYSCIVVIRRPRSGHPSGGLMAGTVVKSIAEKIHAVQTLTNVRKLKPDSAIVLNPRVKAGYRKATLDALDEFDLRVSVVETADWVTAAATDEGIRLAPLLLVQGLVPNVIGMGARDAIYLLELAGLHVSLSGSGTVVSQTIPPGRRAANGQSIGIVLR